MPVWTPNQPTPTINITTDAMYRPLMPNADLMATVPAIPCSEPSCPQPHDAGNDQDAYRVGDEGRADANADPECPEQEVGHDDGEPAPYDEQIPKTIGPFAFGNDLYAPLFHSLAFPGSCESSSECPTLLYPWCHGDLFPNSSSLTRF